MQLISAPTFASRPIVTALAVLALGSAWSAKAQSQTSIARAASQVSWSHVGLEELRGLFRNSASVKDFLHQIDTRGGRMAPDIIAGVKEYKLTDLAGDGWIELIAIVDVTGRAFFNNIVIVSSSPTGFVVRELRGWDIGSLDSALIDLDGNGSLEILVPEPLESYRGAIARPATIVEIYAWNGREYEKASGRFPSYYRDVVLPTLEHRLADVERSPVGLTAIERERRRKLQATYRAEIEVVKKRIAER